MNRGWIKLWRNNLDAGLLQNHKLWAFWCYCLLRATHKPVTQMVGWQVVHLKPGQFIFGRKIVSEDLKLSEQTVRTCLKKLEKLGSLTVKATNKYSIVTVANWDIYQQNQPTANQQLPNIQPKSSQQLTKIQPAFRHKQECYKQECKNGENVRSIMPSFCRGLYSTSDENSSASTQPPKPPNNGEKRSRHPPCPQDKIIKIYHEILLELPAVQSWGGASRKNLQTRWREDSARQNLDWWRWFFQEYVQKSDFLMGRIKEFRADMDWIARQPNFQNILNGRYQNRGPNTGSKLTDKNVRVAQQWASEGLR